jgi:hypothetical protein
MHGAGTWGAIVHTRHRQASDTEKLQLVTESYDPPFLDASWIGLARRAKCDEGSEEPHLAAFEPAGKRGAACRGVRACRVDDSSRPLQGA